MSDASGRSASLALGRPVSSLPGIGPRRQTALREIGISTLEDLLWHLPRAWEDHRTVTPVAQAAVGTAITVRGRLHGLRVRRLRGRRRSLVSGEIRDPSGALPVVWFQQPYLVDQLPREAEVLLQGRVARRGAERVLSHPRWELAAEGSPGVLPLYPALPGMGERLLRRALGVALDGVDLDAELPDPLPAELRGRRGLPSLGQALRELHRPGPAADLAKLATWRSPAQLRLIYGELFAHQLELARRSLSQRRRPKPHRYQVGERLRERAREALPFALTRAQRRVLREMVADLRSPAPMRRLLQGDVGSGKTVVAALLLLMAVENDLQGVLLAPTELLAEQHLATLRGLLGPRAPIALITASAVTPENLAALHRGDLGIAVGTHALLQAGVSLKRLGLVIVDEQHRFGVAQRRLLTAKGQDPDLLVMSATPIPRSLALTLYGDLEVSVLDELPPGRRPVVTEVVPATARRRVYRRLRETLEQGGQAYVVVPRIGEGGERDGVGVPEPAGIVATGAMETEGGVSLEGFGARLLERFSDFPAASLHGRMPASERDRVMAALRRGELRLVVATTVIEVGVDVPGATAMVIESAERFGLAQLHQLRGRVGRGEGDAWCAAVHGPLREEGRRRLEAFAETTDGFALAEADLELRGPGDLLGRRQAGDAPFRWADLARDKEWLELARRDARELAAREIGSRGSRPES